MKINKSQIGRELGMDRRTVGKYIKGFSKSKSKERGNCITPYYEIIKELLEPSDSRIFYYKSILWQYLADKRKLLLIFFCYCR